VSTPSPKTSHWSFHFLKAMAGICLFSPLVGILLVLLATPLFEDSHQPLELAWLGAKWGLLVGGFASPIAALAITTRAILREQADTPSPPPTD
jgi:hypothetical protein